ncbi:unnamed protein product, partial [Closterium sp. NIES-54]
IPDESYIQTLLLVPSLRPPIDFSSGFLHSHTCASPSRFLPLCAFFHRVLPFTMFPNPIPPFLPPFLLTAAALPLPCAPPPPLPFTPHPASLPPLPLTPTTHPRPHHRCWTQAAWSRGG